ncbi:MAG TPA: hypothetical protein VFC78_10990 [Tepidisphaeraceae bacterium]|nr:hypothetical protein [Tepidisphaeraceae bacterium]
MNALRTTIGAAMLGALVALAPGCGPKMTLPMGTQLIASGKTVNGTAPGDGMVYVYDTSTQKVLYQGRVIKGDRVSVVPEKSRIQLNGNDVEQHVLNINDDYQVRFMSQPQGD